MRIKKNLLKPAVFLSTVCLFLAAGGTAEAAELLGIHASDVDDLMDTSTILLIDTALGTSIELADTGLSRVAEGTDSSAVNGPAGPNGLAYDTASGKAYFASVPNSGGGSPILYSVVVDPPGGAPVFLGSPLGRRLFDAAFFDGKYWYIDARTDDLRSISFDAMTGLLASDVLVADILAVDFPGHTFGFGDIAIQDGILYGAGRRNLPFILGGPIVFFTVDLSDPTMSYVEHQTDDFATPVLQLAFGGEGTLFGQTGALTGEQDLYYVSLVPGAKFGERGKVLVDFSGGPYTDMAGFNPLCACKEICRECKGGVLQLTLRFTGGSTTLVEAIKEDKKSAEVLFTGMVDPGGTFTLIGMEKDGKLPKQINLFENGTETGGFHTSCSDPIGPGTSSGNFVVVEAISKDGGLVCAE